MNLRYEDTCSMNTSHSTPSVIQRTAAEANGVGGFNIFSDQIFALDSAVVKAQHISSSHGGFST